MWPKAWQWGRPYTRWLRWRLHPRAFHWQEGENKTTPFKYMIFCIDMASSIVIVDNKHSKPWTWKSVRWTMGRFGIRGWNFCRSSYLTNYQDSTLEASSRSLVEDLRRRQEGKRNSEALEERIITIRDPKTSREVRDDFLVIFLFLLEGVGVICFLKSSVKIAQRVSWTWHNDRLHRKTKP